MAKTTDNDVTNENETTAQKKYDKLRHKPKRDYGTHKK